MQNHSPILRFLDRSRGNAPTAVPLKEIDYRAMRLMMERAEGGSDLAKARHIKQFDRAWKRGELFYAAEDTDLSCWMRCEARFTLGDYSDWRGWQFRNSWAKKCWYKNPFRVPTWNGSRVGKLYVIAEQGLGDEVMLSQVIATVKPMVGELVFECQDRLCSVFERSYGVKTVPAVVGADLMRRYQPFTADAWVPLGELPRAFRRKKSDFIRRPLLVPDPARIAEMEPYRGRVGISWRGAQGHIDWQKLKAMYPDCISLQYDQKDGEDVEKPHFDLKDDIEGIVAFCSVLSKVVSVSTTVAHLAASVGAPLDLVLANHKTGIRYNIMPWRWLDLSCPTVPRKAVWYGDHVNVYQSWGEYVAYSR